MHLWVYVSTFYELHKLKMLYREATEFRIKTEALIVTHTFVNRQLSVNENRICTLSPITLSSAL